MFRVGLWFLCTALSLTAIYLQTKFHLNARYPTDRRTKRRLYASPFGEHNKQTVCGIIACITYVNKPTVWWKSSNVPFLWNITNPEPYLLRISSEVVRCSRLIPKREHKYLPRASHSPRTQLVVKYFTSASRYFGSCSIMFIFVWRAALQNVPSRRTLYGGLKPK